MKTGKILCIAACLLISGCGIFAPDKAKPEAAKPTLRLTLLPQEPLSVGHATTVLLKLNDMTSRTLMTDDMLEVKHTKKLHLLVIDPSFRDYQHIHPQPTATPGIYIFSFTPKRPGGYRAWADVTPVFTGKQEYDMADLGAPKGAGVTKTESHESTVDGYHFTLSFDSAPVAGGESMGSITITDKNGEPVKNLEPVMGAFAHIVGFYDDYRTIVHVHPMGAEPQNDSDRGGPDLSFHLEPSKAAFIKLYAQVKINGKEIFTPFGVNVGKGS